MEALVKAGLVAWLHELLTSTESPDLGPEGIEVTRTLAAEGLLNCLHFCPALVLGVLKDMGFVAQFPALANYSDLMSQRLAVEMLAVAVDLLNQSAAEAGHPHPSRPPKVKRGGVAGGSVTSGSSSKLLKTTSASAAAPAGPTAPPRVFSPAEFSTLLVESGSLPPLTWFLSHYDSQVRGMRPIPTRALWL